MTDAYFDAARAHGEYPRTDYGRQSNEEKRIEITCEVAAGWRLPGVLKETSRLGIAVAEKS
ncbi:hypothetical protein A9R05_42365 (plasmid) [Burkholderia sp. KK1]|uniref:hypothetical protein n=1 Tax=Burkholderia sp. M701 TaxID=326454 RepID=UPI000979B62F|nr:hypothetical protein [Burkholderia sp. M701]AQH05665.1 hypothetical protein A9R05_42365 [Burkholderia sp. KK1]